MQAISMTLVEIKWNKVNITMTNVTLKYWHGIALIRNQSYLLPRKTIEADIIQFTTC